MVATTIPIFEDLSNFPALSSSQTKVVRDLKNKIWLSPTQWAMLLELLQNVTMIVRTRWSEIPEESRKRLVESAQLITESRNWIHQDRKPYKGWRGASLSLSLCWASLRREALSKELIQALSESAKAILEQNEISEIESYLAQLPSCEPWLQNSPIARATVERGLQQAAVEPSHYLGSFAQYADVDTEEE